MFTIPVILAFIYQFLGFILVIYAYFLLITVILFLYSVRRHDWSEATITTPSEWPHVTVQLPIFNEPFVARRLLMAVAALDYPRDRLHIQVLDDSTDETAMLLPMLVARVRQEQGLDITYHHRAHRDGYKAGALAAGLALTTSEFIAVFDADFIPQPDWLRRTVPVLLAHPQLAFVQTRWAHLNHGQNWLTAAQALALDGHFVIEQQARSAVGLWQNFNGSGGLWRRTAILDAGGWQADTVTEDLDLSYRAQLRGWRGAYLQGAETPSELPALLAAYKRQQRRWAQGSTQTLRKLARSLWRSKHPWWRRLYATFHLGGCITYLLLLLLLLLTLPLAWLPPQPRLLPIPAWLSLLAPLGPIVLCGLAQIRLEGLAGLRRLWALPILIVLSAGLAASLAGAVLTGLRQNGGTFERTPKQGEAGPWALLRETTTRSDLLPEGLAFLYATACLLSLAATARWDLALLPLFFFLGSGGVWLQSLREQRQHQRRTLPRVPTPRPESP